MPWLERMGWPTYLQGLDRQILMDLVKTPSWEEELLASIIWDATDHILYHCQQTVKNKAFYYLRREVVRSKVKQTKCRPLQPYMDPDTFKDYARPWKKMIVYLVETNANRPICIFILLKFLRKRA